MYCINFENVPKNKLTSIFSSSSCMVNMVLSVMYPSSWAAISSSDSPLSRDANDKLSTDLLSSHSEFSEVKVKLRVKVKLSYARGITR